MSISATNTQMVNFARIGTFFSVDFCLGEALSPAASYDSLHLDRAVNPQSLQILRIDTDRMIGDVITPVTSYLVTTNYVFHAKSTR